MSKEFKYRLITSFLLIISLIFFVLINEILFLFFISLVLFCSFIEWIKLNYNYFKKKKFIYNLIILLGFLYAVLVLISAKNLRGTGFEDGFYFIFILSICAGSDIGGYLFGKIIGGKKLIKRVSPNKTIAGSIGSFIFSVVPLVIFNIQSYFFFNFNFNFKNILLCLSISLFCQVGDLIISFFKRLNKVKDTGKILPGHGGFLDRIDGIIFTIPIVYIFKVLNIF